MGEETYTNLGQGVNKVNPRALTSTGPMGPEDILTSSGRHSYLEIVESFCVEIKRILATGDLSELIEGIFALENTLEALASDPRYEGDELPHLGDFYQHLSPLLLRLVVESQREGGDEESILQSWPEALRVSLEEEVYLWQEKIQNIDDRS